MRRTLIAFFAVAALCAGAASPASADPAIGAAANQDTIAIPATGTSGVSNPYPSTQGVGNLYPRITDVNVTFESLSHTFPDDIDALLVGPGGQSVLLMSDVGGSTDINNVRLVFDDAAPTNLPDNGPITSGTFRPTNVGTPDPFPSPAPGPPYGSTMSAFNGTNPNGAWRLFIFDDAAADTGQLVHWTLNITAAPNPGRCTNPFVLTPGGTSFDGGVGGDNIVALGGNDRVRGHNGRDCLFGGSGRDVLRGQGGRDRLFGASGRDLLIGGSNRDRLSGGSAGDRLSGGSSNDLILGGSGNDRLRAGGGRNRLFGGSGNDRLNSRNGRFDRDNCGSGFDRVRADSFDAVNGNCEVKF
jgi:Ca2+-binding RTX toxin-like protein